ncbi:MAG: integrase/recombinase XerD [Chloroflexota bacterium]|nr:integrase/recombinase XerD [Chloroflexota bacterium]
MAVKDQLNEQRIISVFSILEWAEAFIIDRKSRGLSSSTITFYQKKLRNFLNYCEINQIHDVQEINARHVREYILWLESKGHNKGGVHAHFRVLRSFLYWYEEENDLTDWVNPIKKVKGRRPRQEPLEPADIDAVKVMLDVCERDFTGVRDRLIILIFLDTGLRAAELLALNFENVDPITGTLQVMHGKGDKFRVVYLGKKSRIALRSYYKKIKHHEGALIIGVHGERLTYAGLRLLLKRRAQKAGVEYQSPHSFRRLFALTMLRNGIDVFSLQLLMGHADLQMLRRYLKQPGSDLQEAHNQASPVDKWKL